MGFATQCVCIALVLVGCCNAQEAGEPIMSCNFDDGLCPGWKLENKELYDWEVRTEPAKETGPAQDRTGGGFLYFNDDSKFGKAVIRTPIMDLSKPPDKHCLRFWYFARGSAPGELRIYHSNKKEGRTVSLFFTAGPKSDNETHWIFVDVSVPTFYSDKKFNRAYFRIQATTGRRDNNVIAIDDVSVTPGPCPAFKFSKTATTAPPGLRPLTVPGSVEGSQQGDLTNEEVLKRNEEIILANEERNRKVQEMNDLMNSGQYVTTQDPDQPTQPTQPTQPIQPHDQTTTYETETMSEDERQQKIQEEQRRMQEEAEKRRNEEQERIERVEKERKELIEMKRREQLEKQRQQREEEERKNKERIERQKQERLKKLKEEEERRKMEMQKKREEQEKKAKKKAEMESKLREEQVRKQREEEERKKKAEEERKRKIEEERNKSEQRNQDQNNNKVQGKRGGRKGKKGNQGGKRRGGKISRKDNPNYRKCGKVYAHKTNQLCCNGLPKKKSKQTMMCCKRVVYDSDLKGCCAGKIYDINGATQCCGAQLYERATHACCTKTPYELATSNCIEGEVQPIAT